ncbi:hypothetical protein [Litoribrevibacter albus]|uniref:hypothetical protein n=1 Tax=Litoribrevibacter albus TaxID=1473156 RepID=UPI0024E06652|nr:hypothetical protein [Litoribrevibacter albus]
MDKIRICLAFILVFSMFLPLSSCDRKVINEETQAIEFQSIERYIIPENASPMYYLWILAFLAPATWCFYSKRIKRQGLVQAIHFVVPIPVLVLVSQHYFTGVLMLGGYLAAFSCLGLIVISVIELLSSKRSFRRQEDV